jgi:hypothetical protein
MITQLKIDIQEKLGYNITGRGHCQNLSDLIYEENRELLNYNTLRRFFALDKPVTPSKTTLNILSRFLGHPSFEKFCKDKRGAGDQLTHIQWYQIFDSDDEQQVLGYLLNLRAKDKNFIVQFTQTLRELLMIGNVAMVNKIFKNKAFRLDQLSYSEVIVLGNGIGSVFRGISLEDDELRKLVSNPFFIKYVVEIFVDYSSLSGYYGKLVDFGHVIKVGKQTMVFFTCLHYLKAYLCKTTHAPLFSLTLSAGNHPILISRIASMQVLQRKLQGRHYDDVLAEVSTVINNTKSQPVDFLYEIKMISLITADFDLMQWLLNKSAESQPTSMYQLSHMQSNYLTRLMLAIKQNDQQNIQITLRKINRKNWVISYFDFLDFFYTIAKFHLARTAPEKKAHQKHFDNLRKKLNCARFTNRFLREYFGDVQMYT